MVLCDNCGHDNKETAKFCHSCGTKIEVGIEIVTPVVEKESTTKILEEERKKAEAELERSGRYRGKDIEVPYVPKYGERTKMRWGVAIAGAILMAIGLIMVVGGGITGTCWMTKTCPTGYGADLSIFISWAIFWIGLIPTIFGVRYVAKA